MGLVQDWDEISIQLGKNGQPDQAALARILITDKKHRARSVRAEEITAGTQMAVNLPAAARDGGALSSDPNTKEQRRLTRGESRRIHAHLQT